MFQGYVLAGQELLVKAVKPRPASGEYRSQLSAFSGAGQTPKSKTSRPRPGQGGYQGRLSAFGTGRGPAGPRRRGSGGSRRH
jgi:hypothetical protein